MTLPTPTTRPTRPPHPIRATTIAALALALGALGALTGTARAQAPAAARAITPPAGWLPQPVKLAPPRPDVTSTAVETYFPPAGAAPGGPRPAALYVTRIERKAAPDRRDAIASGELEEIFAAQRRQGAGAKTEASTRRADPAAKQLEAALTWRDASAGMVDTSRVVVAADAQRVVAVTGQCLLGADAPVELAKACEAALATLDPGIAAAARVPLAMAAEPAPVDAPPAPPAPAGAAGAAPAAPSMSPAPGSGASPAPARLNDASHVALAPRQVQPAQPEPDRRPLYLGAGLVAIALLFWWNRRRRERFERDEPVTAGPAERDAGRDDDDDDLHAAADEPSPAPAPNGARKEKDA